MIGLTVNAVLVSVFSQSFFGDKLSFVFISLHCPNGESKLSFPAKRGSHVAIRTSHRCTAKMNFCNKFRIETFDRDRMRQALPAVNHVRLRSLDIGTNERATDSINELMHVQEIYAMVITCQIS